MVERTQANPPRPARPLLGRADALLAVLAIVIVIALGLALNLLQPVTPTGTLQQSLATAQVNQGGAGQATVQPTEEYPY